MRSTSASGKKLNKYTPRAATLASVENAITGTPRWRAAAPTTPTECANSGPMMISAPSLSACCAASCARAGIDRRHLDRVMSRDVESAGHSLLAYRCARSGVPPADNEINPNRLAARSRGDCDDARRGIGVEKNGVTRARASKANAPASNRRAASLGNTIASGHKPEA